MTVLLPAKDRQRRSRGFRQTRVVRGIRKNSGKRIHFEHVRHSHGIEPNIDPCPVAAAEDAEGVERNSLNRRLKISRDTSGTLENVERILGTIPDELRIEAVDRERALGQRLEIHPDDGQHGRIATVADHGASEFLAGQIFLDENRLLVVLQQELRLASEVRAATTNVPLDVLGVPGFFDRKFVATPSTVSVSRHSSPSASAPCAPPWRGSARTRRTPS